MNVVDGSCTFAEGAWAIRDIRLTGERALPPRPCLSWATRIWFVERSRPVDRKPIRLSALTTRPIRSCHVIRLSILLLASLLARNHQWTLLFWLRHQIRTGIAIVFPSKQRQFHGTNVQLSSIDYKVELVTWISCGEHDTLPGGGLRGGMNVNLLKELGMVSTEPLPPPPPLPPIPLPPTTERTKVDKSKVGLTERHWLASAL